MLSLVLSCALFSDLYSDISFVLYLLPTCALSLFHFLVLFYSLLFPLVHLLLLSLVSSLVLYIVLCSVLLLKLAL